MSGRLIFYGLLHVADVVEAGVNMPQSGMGDPLDAYIRCAALCGRSFRAQGHDWRLVTNRPDRVKARLDALGMDPLAIVAHHFRWAVPEGIPFRSAHHKLELFDAVGRGAFGEHVGIVDLDTVLLRPFPSAVTEATQLVGYDITATETADYGEETVAATLRAVAGRPVPVRWWGGEFLLGPASGFAALSRAIATVWPTYLAVWPELHHQGDEAVVSGAMPLFEAAGGAILDAGRMGGVHRWWSARTPSPRPPLGVALETSLLHLPADKDLLSRQPVNGFDARHFTAALRRHARGKALARRLLSAAERLAGRPARFAPRI